MILTKFILNFKEKNKCFLNLLSLAQLQVAKVL